MKAPLGILFAAALGALLALPAQAAAPQIGPVVEGESVPGIGLGDNRATIEAIYGPPQSCQSVEVAGDRGSCSFPVEGGGTVNVLYRGPLGGSASNSPDDVAHTIRWYEQVSGWVTTAGIDTALAAMDPQAVIDAYPNALVTYNSFGALYRVADYELGIEVLWVPDFYSGTTHVNMAIFSPRNSPPVPEKATHVSDIELTFTKKQGRRIIGLVQVRTETNSSAQGAVVTAHWELPDGTTLPATDTTSRSGYAFFELQPPRRGTYTLRIEDVVLSGYRFDLENSVLSSSIEAR